MKVRYFQDQDDHYIAVTDETPKGPLKGFVFVGRRLIGDTATEEAFGIDQLAKWKKLEIGDVPPRCVEALGYDEPPAPPPEPDVRDEAHDDGIYSANDLINHQPKPIPLARYEWASLAAVLYVAAVLFFSWMKNH